MGREGGLDGVGERKRGEGMRERKRRKGKEEEEGYEESITRKGGTGSEEEDVEGYVKEENVWREVKGRRER